MNANDGSRSNVESPCQDKRDKGEGVENETESAEAEVVTNTTDVINSDNKPLGGWEHFFFLLQLIARRQMETSS